MKTILTIMACLCFIGCVEKSPEPERDKLSEVFNEQYEKVKYYAEMQMKQSDYEKSHKYSDSLQMAAYAQDVVFKKIYQK